MTLMPMVLVAALVGATLAVPVESVPAPLVEAAIPVPTDGSWTEYKNGTCTEDGTCVADDSDGAKDCFWSVEYRTTTDGRLFIKSYCSMDTSNPSVTKANQVEIQ